MSDLDSQLTVVIKTFDRPRLLRNLLQSLRRFYPHVPVIVVDDGGKPALAGSEHPLVRHIRTDFDIGVSAGRNLGVANVETPYAFIMDDDFAFTPTSRLERLLDPVTQRGFGICGSRMVNFGTREICYHGIFEERAGHLRMLNGHDHGSRDSQARLDYCHNVFCASTDLLRRHRWDERLKVHEHWEFFFRLRNTFDVDVTIAPETGFAHFPIRHRGYKRFRNKRDHFEAQALAMSGLKSVEVVGLTTKPDGLARWRESIVKRAYGTYFALTG